MSIIRIFPVFLLLFSSLIFSISSQAGWFGKLVRQASDTAGNGRKTGHVGGFSELGGAGLMVKRLAVGNRGHAIAASVTDDGHWRLMNGAGERVTVSGAPEFEKALSWMVGDRYNRDRRLLTIYVSDEGLIRNPQYFAALPAHTRRVIVARGKAYPLLEKRLKGRDVVFAKVRPSIDIALGDVDGFREVIWHLERPLKRADIRLLALTPGAPQTVPSVPIISANGVPNPDIVDPYFLEVAFGRLIGKTVLLTGRVDRDLLYFQKSGASDLSIFVSDIRKAARANDINLIVLNTGKSRQPGGRDWLWRKIGIQGLEDAVRRDSFGNFLNTLAEERGGFDLSIDRTKRNRVVMMAEPRAIPRGILETADGPVNDKVGSVFSDVVAAITGDVVVSSVLVEMRSSSRQEELDERIIAGIPSDAQFFYLGSILLGFIGFPVARRWWHKVWPPEDHSEYRTRVALGTAVAIRSILFGVVFLPIVGVAAFFVRMNELARRVLMAPFLWIARLIGLNGKA